MPTTRTETTETETETMIGEREERPWGEWLVLDEGEGFKVKRIVVEPGCRLSYQTHEHRAELWSVVAGTATCVVADEVVVLEMGESLRVDVREPHRITNQHETRLVVIEVQLGERCDESDICRLQDDFGRIAVDASRG